MRRTVDLTFLKFYINVRLADPDCNLAARTELSNLLYESLVLCDAYRGYAYLDSEFITCENGTKVLRNEVSERRSERHNVEILKMQENAALAYATNNRVEGDALMLVLKDYRRPRDELRRVYY